MADLVNINLGDTQNLLNYKSLLKDNPTITFGSTGVSSTGTISDVLTIQKEALSFRTFLVQNVSSDLSGYFDFGDALEYTSTRDGNYTFSFYILKGDLNVNPNYNVDIKLKVYINSLLTHTFVKNIPIENGSLQDLRFVQSFDVNEGDVLNFAFEVQKDSVGTPNPNIELFFTGFQLNYGNVTNYEVPNDFYTTKQKEYTGTWDYANTLTAQSFTGTAIYLNNNGLGTNTNKDYRLSTISNIFDTINNAFDFSELEFGDRVDIRFDLTITTTSANQNVKVSTELGIGSTPYEISFLDKDFKTATSHTQTFSNWFYIGNSLTKDFPAKVKFFSDANATILVNGWAVNVIKRK